MGESLQQNAATLQALIETAERQGMRKSPPLNHLVTKMAKIAGVYPIPNIAVEACFSAWTTILQQQMEKKASPEAAAQVGRLAYCAALPRLTDADCIREFIACVVHGMAIGAIPSTEGTRLLYGAQVAHSALPSPKRHKKRNKSTQNTQGNHPPTQTESAA
jgi:hypothetical protein